MSEDKKQRVCDKTLAQELEMLSSRDLAFLARFIRAIKSNDEEAEYKCWKDAIDESKSIPECVVDNKFTKRYLEENPEAVGFIIREDDQNG